MTLAPPDHIHISEREADGSWEDCTWDSGLEWYRLVYDARKPATHAEAQLLRKASGEPATGGSNLGDLARGIKVRYGTVIPDRLNSFAALRAALTHNKAAVIQGGMDAFGPTHRLSKWQTNFEGAHAVVLINYGGKLLWCDPLAPASAAVPVEVTWAEVEKFVRAFSGQHVVGTIRNIPKEAPVANLTTYLPGYTASVKAGSNIRSEPRIASTKLHATVVDLPVQVVGTVKGDVDPANGSDVWYELWHDNRSEYTAKDNVINLKAPAAVADDGYTKETQEAAVALAVAAGQAAIAAVQTELDAKNARIAELQPKAAVGDLFIRAVGLTATIAKP